VSFRKGKKKSEEEGKGFFCHEEKEEGEQKPSLSDWRGRGGWTSKKGKGFLALVDKPKRAIFLSGAKRLGPREGKKGGGGSGSSIFHSRGRASSLHSLLKEERGVSTTARRKEQGGTTDEGGTAGCIRRERK